MNSQEQKIARQVLINQREARRVAAVRARQDRDDVERYRAELDVIADDLVAEGFTYGSAAFWEAAMKIMVARHVTKTGDELDARMNELGF